MNLVARINGNTLEIFNPSTGGLHKSHSLPPGDYTGPTISGDLATVIIKTQYSGDKIRTINMNTGSIVREISM